MNDNINSVSYILLLLSLFMISSCDLFDDAEEDAEFEYDNGIERFETGEDGEIFIEAGSNLEDYEEVIYEFEIQYEDGEPASNANVFYEEEKGKSTFYIKGKDEESSPVIISGTPEEIKEYFDGLEHSRVSSLNEEEKVDAQAALITITVAGVIKLVATGAKIYSKWRTTQAIWNNLLDVYRISEFLVTDIEGMRDDAIVYCKEFDDLEGLSRDLESLVRGTGKLVISFATPDGDLTDTQEIFKVAGFDAASRAEDYVVDFIYDKAFDSYRESHNLDDEQIGVKVYPLDLLMPRINGEKTGYIEVSMEIPECEGLGYGPNVRYAPGDGYEHFITIEEFDVQDDIPSMLQDQFGPEAELVEWNDLKDLFEDDENKLLDYLEGIGMIRGKEEFESSALVTNNDQRFRSGSRHYFISRHDGDVPGGWAVHDHLHNNRISLGSWHSDREALVRVPE